MTIKSALNLVAKHGKGLAADSFPIFLLDCELSGKASLKALEKINSELIGALEKINRECRSDRFSVVRLDLMMDMTVILTQGWDMCSHWITTHYLPEKFLIRFTRILSDLGFAWARLLDGSTPNLKRALKRRHAMV